MMLYLIVIFYLLLGTCFITIPSHKHQNIVVINYRNLSVIDVPQNIKIVNAIHDHE